ncbi:MAG: FAD-dependent oxidoreductase [Coriobacteriales bacterium]|jgi:succinate dehydrogenase/fumarate reductase flavoprotein subunit|nr:FAD-dependent oxidoreductase [Coriobacteriales bacterium]
MSFKETKHVSKPNKEADTNKTCGLADLVGIPNLATTESSSGISRRDLLKGAGVGAAAVAAFGSLGALGACAPTNNTGQGTGTTTYANDSANSSSHSWDIANKPADIPASDIIETIDTEILVCGGGFAGTATAARAAELGAKVILVEKDAVLHGNGIGGTGAAWSKVLEENYAPQGYYIDKPVNQARWVKTCAGRCRESLVAKWFRESEKTMDWMLDMSFADGATCLITANASNQEIHKEEHSYHWLMGGSIGKQIPADDLGGGFGPDAAPSKYPEINMATIAEYRFKAFAEETGNAQFVFESPVVQLIQPGGPGTAVKGAICKTDKGYVQYNASKGVVLATGDISFNDEMLDYFAPIGQKVYTKLNGANGNVGDGHKLGSWAGGALQDGPWATMMHPQALAGFHGPFMFVDPTGNRFFNEATWVQGKCVGVITQAKVPDGFSGQKYAWSIFDANWKQYLLDSLPVGGGMFWDTFRMFGSTYETAVSQIASQVEGGLADETGNFVQADTIEELAEKIDVPVSALKASVERYNEFAKKGMDEDFYKDPTFVTPIAEAPFIAAKVGTGLLAVCGGLHVSDDLEVLGANEKPIPGLYAIGNTMGDIYAVDYPINIQGNSHGRCLTFGYLLGEHLAKK